ncbi:hypothetical protein COTS27_00454 [Spirochaetota bacterium]|nr:hypothetical protein COTS27_00454 [Spirochaetota bacterium]
MQRWFVFVLMILAGLGGFISYLVYYSLEIETQEERLYTFLIEGRNKANERTSAQVLFFHYPENFFLLYQINHKLSIPNKKRNPTPPYINAYTLPTRKFKKVLTDFYDINIDFTITVRETDELRLLSNWGGTAFFNLHSTYLDKGLGYLDAFNYKPFIEDVTDSDRIREVKLSIWYNILKQQLILATEQNNYKNTLIDALNSLTSDLNRQTLAKLLAPLIATNGEIYFFLLRSNLETIKKDATTYYIALEKGNYDKRKIADYFLTFKERALQYEQFPIAMQIKNTTPIKRLAARTAGVLRIKRIDVKEYLNSPIDLSHSVLIDFAHSPIKINYVKQVTRVSRVYSLFDYRESFDFSLYIADDYYGIAYLKDLIAE